MAHSRFPEQRHHFRYQLNENIFVDIHGNDFDHLGSVTDLNSSGVGFYSVKDSPELADKFIKLDLVFNSSYAIIRSLLCQVIYNYEIIQETKATSQGSRMYGLKFVNTSALQRKQLEIISKKYALPT